MEEPLIKTNTKKFALNKSYKMMLCNGRNCGFDDSPTPSLYKSVHILKSICKSFKKPF